MRDPRVDAYIAKSADFAKPILEYLRATVHEACPDVEETIRWSMPSFTHAGQLMCNMAAFKAHCAFGFWKHALVLEQPGGRQGGDAMGSLGRITSVDDLPAKRTLVGYIKRAAKLNEEGVKAPARKKTPAKKAVVVPPDFRAALMKNAKALAAFEAFSPSHKREYVEWITEAKRDETRVRRLEQAVAQIAEGKSRNWKYERR